MTQVNGSYPSAGAQSAQGEPVRAAVNLSDAQQMENTFITLMTAQIRNQDPTQPLDSNEFLQQFSSMSQVKSMENMASLTRSNLVLLDNLQTLTAAGLVGQQVRVGVEQLELGEQPLEGRFELRHAAGETQLQLTDSAGRRHAVALPGGAPGVHNFTLDPQALGLAPGRYRLEASSDTGEYPRIEFAGMVEQVRVSEDGPVLQVTGLGAIPFYNITEFGQVALTGLL